MRSSTGVRVLHKHLTSKGTISVTHPTFEEDLRTIQNQQENIEDIVSGYFDEHGEKPSVNWLEQRLGKAKSKATDKPGEAVPVVSKVSAVEIRSVIVPDNPNVVAPVRDPQKDTGAFYFWPDFLAEKRQVIRNENSIKRYNNLRVMLEAFEGKNNMKISFDIFNQEFFNGFLSYMVNEYEFYRNKYLRRNADHKPEVGIANETAIKRMKDFVEYLKYCVVERDVNINLEKIKKYIKFAKHKHSIRPLSKTQRWELTLTTDEIQFVVNLDQHAPDFLSTLSDNQKRYLDIFIFMCLQGTAPVDTKAINKTHIRNGRIVKERSKSGNEFRVDLHSVSESILIRNSYNLDFSDPTLNAELKRIFTTIFELYRLFYESQNDDAYEIVCTQKYKKSGREIFKIQHKALFIELMTGRRSFLTNLGEKADELGIKQIMDKAGHTVIGTTLGYIHTRQNNKKGGWDLFGIRKIKAD